MHVFGPVDRYPLASARDYTPALASLAAYREVMTACGIAHAVLVQPSVYGHDHRQLFDALRAGGPAFRGVAVPSPTTSEVELDEMHAVGVRGIRLNGVNQRGLASDAALRLIERIGERGWHLDLQVRWDAETTSMVERLASHTGAALVFDHFARPTARDGVVAAPALLLDLLRDGRGWVKLSAPYRVHDDPHAPSLAALAQAFVGANADRVLWGSDWPHTERFTTMPVAADLVDQFTTWFPDADLRTRLCVTNPRHLYDH